MANEPERGAARIPRVVIVGGGFAGLNAARELRKAPVEVTLVDRYNHHLFQPLLYQVATAGLGAPDIASPLRKILRRHGNVTVLMAEVEDIDPEQHRLTTGAGTINYDYLIVAAGAAHSYFGRDDWAPYAPGLKSLDDALEIRRRILLAFESAEIEADPERQRRLLTFVVVGAGPTGVELAGALAEMSRHTLVDEFRHFDPREARVVLVDMADRVLPGYPDDLSANARKQLERLGVEVHTGTPVVNVTADSVELNDRRIETHTVIWAAGVAASPLAKKVGAPLDKAGRILVNPDLSVPGHPEIFVAGDLAAVPRGDDWVPGVAPAAIQEGRHAARNVLCLISDEPTRPFDYTDKGSLATIGRSRAVADVFGMHLTGLWAWLLWLFVHLLYLVGFRNRASVLFDWMLAYLTYQRAARIIFPQRSLIDARQGRQLSPR